MLRIKDCIAPPLLLALGCLGGCSGPPRDAGSATPSPSADTVPLPPQRGPGSAEITITPPPSPPPAPAEANWPGIHVDRERRQLDLDARVVLREGDWLELIACAPGTREHEAILAVDAKPSHIHLALLSLGLQPGHPIQSRVENDQLVVVPPVGPGIEITLIIERDGNAAEIPVNEWVLDQRAGEKMPPTRFLFTGSAFVEHEGQTLYMADLEGSIVSLVNFGDDLITRDTTQTNQTDNAQWGAHTDAIPPVGTRVTLRLRASE